MPKRCLQLADDDLPPTKRQGREASSSRKQGATSHAGMSQGAKALQALGLGQHAQRSAKKPPRLAAVPEDSVPAAVEVADGMPCTPVKQPMGHAGCQTCPGRLEVLGSRKAARPGSVPLPTKYTVLLDMFGALQTACRLLTLRGQRCLFPAIKAAVEQQSHRRFTEQHLAQLKSVYPEVLQLQRVRLARSDRKRHDVELLIEMALEDSAAPPAPAAAAAATSGQREGSAGPACAAASEEQRPAPGCTQPGQAAGSKGGRVCDATPERRSTAALGPAATPSRHRAASPSSRAFTAEMGAMRLELERRLSNLVLQHYKGFLETQGRPLQIPADAATAGAAAAWDEDFEWERVPDVEAADLAPVQPSEDAAALAPKPETPPSAARVPSATTAARVAHTAPPGARRLSFGKLATQRLTAIEEGGAGCSGAAQQPGGSGEEDFVAVPSSLEAILSLDPLAGLPDSMRRQSRDGTLPVSLGSLQDMRQQEAQHIALHGAEAVQERRQSLAAGMLPRALDALRNVFGTSGPVCRPQSEVVAHLLQSTQASSSEEAKELLSLLSATASEWLTLQPARQEGAEAVVRINRRADIKTTRRRLQDMAGRRSSMGGSTLPTQPAC